jgi:hypothetical protein
MNKRKKILAGCDLRRFGDLFDYNHLPFYVDLDEYLLILHPKYEVNVEDSNKNH